MTVSNTMGVNTGRLCIGDASQNDIGCPTYAPAITSGGLLTATSVSATNIYGNTASLTSLYVGGVAVTGGGGSAGADRIVSTTGSFANVVAGNGGTVSFSTGGVSGTTYFDTTGRHVGPGISITTNQSSFTTVYASGNTGIGTSPGSTARLTMSANTSTPVAPVAGTVLHMIGANATSLIQQMDGYGASGQIQMRTASGTLAAPAALVTNSTMGQITFMAYGSTGYLTGSGAKIDGYSGDQWSDSNAPAGLRFYSRPAGSTGASLERIRLDPDGKVGIGFSVPTHNLEVSGSISATSLYVGGVQVTGGGGGGSAGADRIVSTSGSFSNVVAGNGGTVSFSTGGTSGTAYLDTVGRYVGPGISTTTNRSSFTTIYSSGPVMIGSGTAAGLLNVVGERSYFTGTSEQMSVGVRYSLGSGFYYIGGSNNANPDLVFSNVGTTERMRLTHLGWLGIGRTSPNAAVDVSGSVSATGLYISGTSYVSDLVIMGAVGGSGTNPTLSGGSGGGLLDRIVSTTGSFANVVAGNGGTVSFSTGGVSGTAYLDTTGRLVGPGISITTHQSSFTTIYSSRNMGIGTPPASSASLDISGTGGSTVVGIGRSSSGAASLEIGSNATGNHYAYIDLTGDATYTDWGLRILRDNTGPNATAQIYNHGTGTFSLGTMESGPLSFVVSSSVRMVVSNSGDVGIGKSTPEGTLHLYKSNAGGVGAQLILDGIGSSYSDASEILFADGGVAGGLRARIRSTVEFPTAYGNIAFSTGLASNMFERMRIAGGTGYVGISTTEPSATLHVAGNGFLATGILVTESRLGYSNVRIGGGGAGVGYSPRVIFDSISDTAPWQIDNEMGTFRWYRPGVVYMSIVSSTGNVGISTSSPAAKLTVAGTVSATNVSVTQNVSVSGILSAAQFVGLKGLLRITSMTSSGTWTKGAYTNRVLVFATGGGGGAASARANGGNGAASSFGSYATGGGGSGARWYNWTGAATYYDNTPGDGGTATVGDILLRGGAGTAMQSIGGAPGGDSFWGGSGKGGNGNGNTVATSGYMGGGGGGEGDGYGTGGGAGGTAIAVVDVTALTTVSVVIGGGGGAGGDGAGGNGSAGAAGAGGANTGDICDAGAAGGYGGTTAGGTVTNASRNGGAGGGGVVVIMEFN